MQRAETGKCRRASEMGPLERKPTASPPLGEKQDSTRKALSPCGRKLHFSRCTCSCFSPSLKHLQAKNDVLVSTASNQESESGFASHLGSNEQHWLLGHLVSPVMPPGLRLTEDRLSP